jgi:prolyl 4-hydroxylase
MTGSDYRIRIGKEVAERLERDEGALRIASHDLDIFIVPDFLDRRDCDTLVAAIDAHRIPSKLLSPTADPEFRNSESCNLDPQDPFVQKIEARIAGLLAIDRRHGETIQGQRYAPGQRFKLHHDFFDRDQPYWKEMDRSGGQRTWTAMIFLNEPEAGGETAFPKADIMVTPRTGNMLVWNNLNIIGEPNYFSLHEGRPVTAGVKYIITKWHRERPWTYSDTPYY